MRFGEPLYFYLIGLIPLLIAFMIWGEKKRKMLSAQFVDASLLSRLVSPGAVPAFSYSPRGRSGTVAGSRA